MDSLVPVASRHSEVAKHQWSGQTLPSLLSSAFRTRRRITSWCFSLNSSPLLPGSLLNGGFHSPETSHQAAAAAAAAAHCCSLTAGFTVTSSVFLCLSVASHCGGNHMAHTHMYFLLYLALIQLCSNTLPLNRPSE